MEEINEHEIDGLIKTMEGLGINGQNKNLRLGGKRSQKNYQI